LPVELVSWSTCLCFIWPGISSQMSWVHRVAKTVAKSLSRLQGELLYATASCGCRMRLAAGGLQLWVTGPPLLTNCFCWPQRPSSFLVIRFSFRHRAQAASTRCVRLPHSRGGMQWAQRRAQGQLSPTQSRRNESAIFGTKTQRS
jgi:hypothetical protein